MPLWGGHATTISQLSELNLQSIHFEYPELWKWMFSIIFAALQTIRFHRSNQILTDVETFSHRWLRLSDKGSPVESRQQLVVVTRVVPQRGEYFGWKLEDIPNRTALDRRKVGLFGPENSNLKLSRLLRPGITIGILVSETSVFLIFYERILSLCHFLPAKPQSQVAFHYKHETQSTTRSRKLYFLHISYRITALLPYYGQQIEDNLWICVLVKVTYSDT